MMASGFHSVPRGMVATVVTHLEMRAAPAPRPVPAQPGLTLTRLSQPSPDRYRALFRLIGTEWLWFSRLGLSNEELVAILGDPHVDVHVVVNAEGRDVGLLELDFRQGDDCELAFFGLERGTIGLGAGRWLMSNAIKAAFSQKIERFHVHTCTLDSPGALPFYIRSGFVPIRQEIEIAPDPRLTGTLPRSAGPHVPILD